MDRSARLLRLRLRSPHLRARSVVTIAGALLLALGVASPALAAGGDLDTSFGVGGKVETNFTPRFDGASSVAAQPDGKLVAAGTADRDGPNPRFALARYTTDGSLDPTFGGDGMVTTDFTRKGDGAFAVAVQPNGKIVAAGLAGFSPTDFDTEIAIARYKVDGTLDAGFGGDGRVTTDLTRTFDDANAIALQPDGKIVVAGYADGAGAHLRFGVARYRLNGTLDRTFGSDGTIITSIRRGAAAYGVAVQADGKIVVSGESLAGRANTMFTLVRYDADGTLDASFGGDGKVTTDFTPGADANNAIAIQADGKIVASGSAGSRSRFALARYDPNGTLDATFGGDGKVTTAFSRQGDRAEEGLGIQADGKIVAAGVARGSGPNPTFALARYNVNGTLDPTFGGDGRVRTDISRRSDDAIGLVIQGDGSIVAAGVAGERGEGGGDARFALARYLPA
jgi:uncharacterized delta-60 repeat protein